jgi:hypothetical protein
MDLPSKGSKTARKTASHPLAWSLSSKLARAPARAASEPDRKCGQLNDQRQENQEDDRLAMANSPRHVAFDPYRHACRSLADRRRSVGRCRDALARRAAQRLILIRNRLGNLEIPGILWITLIITVPNRRFYPCVLFSPRRSVWPLNRRQSHRDLHAPTVKRRTDSDFIKIYNCPLLMCLDADML